MKITIANIGKEVGVAESSLSNIFSGRRRPGRRVALRFQALTGRNWFEYLGMEPEEIAAELRAAIKDAGDGGPQ